MTNETKAAFKTIGNAVKDSVKKGTTSTGRWFKQVGKAITTNPNKEKK